MTKNLLTLFLALLVIGSFIISCKIGSGNTAMGDPKSSISHQFDLIKAGDYENLKMCLTPRVRDSLTKDIVNQAKIDSVKYTMEDLYDSAETDNSDGKKIAKVKMKNGRTLTTLVETDGKWLSDSIWFK